MEKRNVGQISILQPVQQSPVIETQPQSIKDVEVPAAAAAVPQAAPAAGMCISIVITRLSFLEIIVNVFKRLERILLKSINFVGDVVSV